MTEAELEERIEVLWAEAFAAKQNMIRVLKKHDTEFSSTFIARMEARPVEEWFSKELQELLLKK